MIRSKSATVTATETSLQTLIDSYPGMRGGVYVTLQAAVANTQDILFGGQGTETLHLAPGGEWTSPVWINMKDLWLKSVSGSQTLLVGIFSS